MRSLVGEQQSYYSWDRGGELYRLTPEDAEKALAITGVSKAKDGGDLHKHHTS